MVLTRSARFCSASRRSARRAARRESRPSILSSYCARCSWRVGLMVSAKCSAACDSVSHLQAGPAASALINLRTPTAFAFFVARCSNVRIGARVLLDIFARTPLAVRRESLVYATLQVFVRRLLFFFTFFLLFYCALSLSLRNIACARDLSLPLSLASFEKPQKLIIVTSECKEVLKDAKSAFSSTYKTHSHCATQWSRRRGRVEK